MRSIEVNKYKGQTGVKIVKGIIPSSDHIVFGILIDLVNDVNFQFGSRSKTEFFI